MDFSSVQYPSLASSRASDFASCGFQKSKRSLVRLTHSLYVRTPVVSVVMELASLHANVICDVVVTWTSMYRWLKRQLQNLCIRIR